MKRKSYSAGAVKFSFWFMEFRKVVQLLASGKDYKEIKRLSEEENNFGVYFNDRRNCCSNER